MLNTPSSSCPGRTSATAAAAQSRVQSQELAGNRTPKCSPQNAELPLCPLGAPEHPAPLSSKDIPHPSYADTSLSSSAEDKSLVVFCLVGVFLVLFPPFFFSLFSPTAGHRAEVPMGRLW